ncbi:DeoR family transcriptional regulator [Paenibacillus sp. BK033]|uniref:DeoR/GlpR family DNA-binding transcription regulator n=1 Tax=Paenibacillus sp. BK033 TaxID=2512133 RepID=UPI001047A2CC|nr:DeoR/GlpR family DNA-binding transcription regulator [Paenibacillus sp. BK033]TCM97842.1 DeoR family transcriptional regulator [Paenibacillus sp. BK033]
MNHLRRYESIMEVLLTQREVTVAELSERLSVTGKTIREDLTKLEEQGLVKRVHGGAVLANSDQFGILPVKEPIAKHADEKTDIADTAMRFISGNDIIALDGGSTTLEIAKRLSDFPVTVITNDVYIISELAGKENVRLVVPGGYRVRNVLAGPEAVAYVRSLNINKAFISATGVHLEHGLSVYTGDLIDFKQALMSTARECYGVADHHKFGHSALRTFARLSELTALLTDKGLPEDTAAAFRAAGVRLEN